MPSCRLLEQPRRRGRRGCDPPVPPSRCSPGGGGEIDVFQLDPLPAEKAADRAKGIMPAAGGRHVPGEECGAGYQAYTLMQVVKCRLRRFAVLAFPGDNLAGILVG